MPTPYGTGGKCPHFYKWLDTGAPWVEKQPTRNNQTVLTIMKVLTKTINCTFKTKKVEGHNQKISFPALCIAAPHFCATPVPPPHFQIRSGATAFCSMYYRTTYVKLTVKRCCFTMHTSNPIIRPHSAAQSRHLSLFGHITRMPEQAEANKILTAFLRLNNRRRPLGRYCITWLKTIPHDLKSNDLYQNETIDMAQYRDRPLCRDWCIARIKRFWRKKSFNDS